MESIQQHKVPQWYEDEKFGIFIHWGAYSVPAWAPPVAQLGEVELDERWFCNNPYAEWYFNSIKVGKGPSYEHHVKTYGKTFEYENFTHMWKAENWDPQAWAELFKKAGAKYVVLTTKHHDGFCLWPSRYTDYNVTNRGPKRDIMGDLTEAVRGAGLRMGAYYSGIIDWRFTHRAMFCDYDVHNPDCVTSAYADYAFNQAMELIDRYKPSVLWNDIDWPKKGIVDLPVLFAHYYNTVPDGVTDDRWNGAWEDFSTKEYKYGEKSLEKKWEMCRGLGLSFGYNQSEDDSHLISKNGLVNLLIDTVAYNGNLLINVGPKADGTIPENQAERLKFIGRWLKDNGEAIYNTCPHTVQQRKAATGEDVYFTAKNDCYYILLDNVKEGDSSIVVPNVDADTGKVFPVGRLNADFTKDGSSLIVNLKNLEKDSAAVVVKVLK